MMKVSLNNMKLIQDLSPEELKDMELKHLLQSLRNDAKKLEELGLISEASMVEFLVEKLSKEVQP